MATESKHETGRHGHAKFICAWREARERAISNADFAQKASAKVQKGQEDILYATSMRNARNCYNNSGRGRARARARGRVEDDVIDRATATKDSRDRDR